MIDLERFANPDKTFRTNHADAFSLVNTLSSVSGFRPYAITLAACTMNSFKCAPEPVCCTIFSLFLPRKFLFWDLAGLHKLLVSGRNSSFCGLSLSMNGLPSAGAIRPG